MPPTVEETFARFADKVEVTETCWLWTASKNQAGYGQFMAYHHKGKYAHRYAYEHLVEPIPADREIDHLCRVKHCVNPDHLELVTHAENIQRAFQGITHCRRGHAYDEANTRIRRGTKECRTCGREEQQRIRDRRKVRFHFYA